MRQLGFAVGIVLGLSYSALLSSKPSPVASDKELTQMYKADQADRTPMAGKPVDWGRVTPRDQARRERTLAIYRAEGLASGEDYYHAAMILQHGVGDDQLLAHELCVSALALGYKDARWLAAASEDRWLGHIGRSQRFATQYVGLPPDFAPKLLPVDPQVTDAHRRSLGCPTLDQAKERERTLPKGR